MAKRRTRAEKKLAALRRQLEVKQERKIVAGAGNIIEYKPEVKTEIKPKISYEGMGLTMNLVRADLTKTGIVAILALILQLALSFYLQRGGWPIIRSLLKI